MAEAALATSSAPAGAILRARGVGKLFSGVRALGGVDFDLAPGRVHALIGENGAGKSTFAKIIGGVHEASEGTLELEGRQVSFPSPLAAQRAGVSLIHQEPLSFPHLSVAENISLGLPGAGALSRMRWARENARARALLDELGVDLAVTRPMGGLPIADQQMVEIATAIAADSRILIMDEPTAPLTPREVALLFAIVRRLRDEGRAIIFISHRLEEVREIADDFTVFRDGALVASGRVGNVTNADLIHMMIGRELLDREHESAATTARVLAVAGLSSAGRFADVSFELHRGEVLGMAGLVGAGRTDVAQAIFGALPIEGGEIRLHDRLVRFATPAEAIAAGLAYVPEDRAQDGIFASLSVAENVTAAVPGRFSRRGVIRPRAERALVGEALSRMSVRLASPRQTIATLSGGNQQKTILGRWLLADPEILILDEPTRGIDIGVKAEFYAEIRKLAAEGRAILLISSELPEILALSDRVVVMCEGHVTATLTQAGASEARIMAAAVPGGEGS